MKTRSFHLLIICLLNYASYSQTYDYSVKCSKDTLTLEGIANVIDKGPTPYSYNVIECETRSVIGFRLGTGISGYGYNVYTNAWLGNHLSPSLNASIVSDKFSFGLRFKPWVVSPRYPKSFGSSSTPIRSDVAVIKLDFYAGYSFDTKSNISFEPYFGYSISALTVANNWRNQSISRAGGLILGLTLNKYTNLKDFGYFAFFISGGHSWVDFNEISGGLDRGYFEMTVGVAFKKYSIHRFKQRV